MNNNNYRLLILTGFFLFSLAGNSQVLINDPAYTRGDTTPIRKDSVLNFIVMGDWGRNGADHQKEVARQMDITATVYNTQFIISTGDNFYPSGVISEWDPLWRYSFEDIYTGFHLQWDWYPVLGNHDYKSNPDAQVKYSRISRRWQMPARYYSQKFFINGDTSQAILIAFIDTNPLIPLFYKNREYGPNVRSQDSTKQKKWLEKVLSDPSPNIKWKIVVGHHPIYSGGGRTETYDTKAIRNWLSPVFEKYKVDVYLSGHEHSLQYMKPAGTTHHFISGAASEKTPAILIDISKFSASEYGFMLFSIQGKQLSMQTIDYTGKSIYQTTLSH